MLGEEEFEEELSLGRKLEALGILDEGKLNHSLFLEVLAVAKKDPYAKIILVRFVAENFKENFKKATHKRARVRGAQVDQGFRGVPAGPSQG